MLRHEHVWRPFPQPVTVSRARLEESMMAAILRPGRTLCECECGEMEWR